MYWPIYVIFALLVLVSIHDWGFHAGSCVLCGTKDGKHHKDCPWKK